MSWDIAAGASLSEQIQMFMFDILFYLLEAWRKFVTEAKRAAPIVEYVFDQARPIAHGQTTCKTIAFPIGCNA